MYTLKDLILAVEENNNFNNAQWSDWEDVDHVKGCYFGDENFKDVITESEADEILERAIKTNGKSLVKDAEEYDLKANNGVAFGGSGYWVDVLKNTYAALKGV